MINFSSPPLDLHAWRQLRGAAIARGMYYTMLPDADPALRQQARYLAGPFQHQEPRVFERLVALTYLLAGGAHLWIARIYALLFWLLGGLGVYDLARRMVSVNGALFALAYWLFLPYAVSHSRMFIPDVLMMMLIPLGLLAVYRWHQQHTWRWALLAGLACGIAILVKVFAVFFLALPAGLFILAGRGFRRSLRDIQVWLVFALMLSIPAVHYLNLSSHWGAGDYIETWLQPFLGLLLDIHFYIGWFHKLGQFNLTLVILGMMAVPLMPRRAPRAMVAGLWLGYLLYGMLLPAPIRSHSYYSLPMVLVVALSLAQVGELCLSKLQQQSRFWKQVFVLIVLLALGDSAWMARKDLTAGDYRAEPDFWQDLGEQLPTDGAFIGLSEDYNMRLLYYGWRFAQEYPYSFDVQMGALSGHSFETAEPTFENWRFFRDRTHPYRYFLVTVLDEFEKQPYLNEILFGYYPVVMEGDRYVLFDLKYPVRSLPYE